MENIPKDEPVRSRRPGAVVIGVSAGGMEALKDLLPFIPVDFALPIIIVQHLHPLQDQFFIETMNEACSISVGEAEEKESISPGRVYFAPPNYHLQIES